MGNRKKYNDCFIDHMISLLKGEYKNKVIILGRKLCEENKYSIRGYFDLDNKMRISIKDVFDENNRFNTFLESFVDESKKSKDVAYIDFHNLIMRRKNIYSSFILVKNFKCFGNEIDDDFKRNALTLISRIYNGDEEADYSGTNNTYFNTHHDFIISLNYIRSVFIHCSSCFPNGDEYDIVIVYGNDKRYHPSLLTITVRVNSYSEVIDLLKEFNLSKKYFDSLTGDNKLYED